MKIFVKVKTGAKEDKITPPPASLFATRDDAYKVSVRERPVEGRANEAIAKLLAEHFEVSRSQVRLIAGAHSKQKVFEINSL